jgi:hypothetical protein
MNGAIVLSYIQAQTIVHARDVGMQAVQVSPDLGLTTTRATLHAQGISFPDGQSLNWEQINEITTTSITCFMLEQNTLHKIQAYSPTFNRFYSLMPTEGVPTILIGGFPMHRIKNTDPYQDTLKKMRAAGSLRGNVLDISTGLGYTAIEAARTAAHVTTIEIDATTLEIARSNPWSRTLFESPTITQIIGDACTEIQTFADACFSRIIHDPPTFQLAGELYSGAFYRELFRVLKANGRLFHYIGSLESKSGHGVARGVVRRLGEAGFRGCRHELSGSSGHGFCL